MIRQRNTLLSYLDDFAANAADTAIVHREGWRGIAWSYQRVAEAAFSWADELGKLGVGKGDRVLLWAENSAHWVAAFYACLLRGAVVVPLDVQSAPDFVARVQQKVSARLLLVSRSIRPAVDLADLPRVVLEELGVSPLRQGSVLPENSAGSGDLAEIVFTSGTTAEPRGVCLTHRNLLANLAPLEREIQKYLEWERWFHPVRFLNLVPLSHVFGQFMGMFVPQLLSGVVHFENALNAGAIIETVRQQRISVVVAVPRILDTLRQKLEQAADVASLVQSNEDTSFPRRVWRARSAHRRFGWKFWAFVSGGATLNPETEAFFHRLGFAVVQGYGMTETAALITVAHPFHIQKHSVGKVLPGREVKVTNGGEVLVRGDNVAAGVWNNGIQPVTDFDGWLHTGDLAQQDQSGNLFFRGRQKDVIVTSAGIKIYPEDIEAALNQQPEVKASVVIGLEGADGPEPVAVLILREHGCGAESIIDHANQKLGPLQQVRRWMIWPETEFPRTATQKIQKPAIGRWAESTLARQSAEPSSLSKSDLSTLAALISRITRTLPATTQPSSRLDLDFKLDSIGRVELLALLEDHYQIELDETSIATASTLGEIQKLVAQAGVCPIAESEGLSPIEDFQPSPKAEERRGTAAGSLDGLEPTERAAQPLAQAPYPYPRWALSKAVNAIRFCSHWPLLPLARVLCRVRVRGREQISQLGGPILIIANHVTYFDPGLILYTLPSHLGKQLVIAMDGDRLRRWRYPPMTLPPLSRFGWRLLYVLICGLVNVYSLPQTGAFRRSFRYAGEAMDRGYSVLIFPEGRLTADGNMNAFRPGIGLLAAGLGVSILPVRLDRLFELRQAWSERKWITPWDMQAQVTVSFGEPLQIRKDETPEAITRRLEQAVSALAETK